MSDQLFVYKVNEMAKLKHLWWCTRNDIVWFAGTCWLLLA